MARVCGEGERELVSDDFALMRGPPSTITQFMVPITAAGLLAAGLLVRVCGSNKTRGW